MRRVLVPGAGGRFDGGVEYSVELLADLASLSVVVFPLMGVEAKGGVRFAVSEAMLDVDEVGAEGDQQAGVGVTEVV